MAAYISWQASQSRTPALFFFFCDDAGAILASHERTKQICCLVACSSSLPPPIRFERWRPPPPGRGRSVGSGPRCGRSSSRRARPSASAGCSSSATSSATPKSGQDLSIRSRSFPLHDPSVLSARRTFPPARRRATHERTNLVLILDDA